MSYIGKNPKVDSVKLEGSATAASGTEEGQLYYNTGTGSISKGLKVFKNSQFVAIDKQLGDADTFHLLKAADISTAEFSAARNSTSTSFLNQRSVPFETTTASGAAGTFSNSSTGDALLTDESADLVFAYKSSGTSDDAQEYFGIPLTVPKAFRGGNIVLTFEYRTGFGTGTTATVDGDFEVSVLDKSSGNGGQTTSTNTSGTTISAGSDITVASKTGLVVGQRIRLETGSSTIAAGSPDATVTEAFITEISSTANTIKISEDYDPCSTSGSVVVSGWLTDVVPGQLKAADSQTNKQGKKFSIQFKTEDDTSDIVLFFQNKNTSSTISRHLFVDNILLSANKFLQASSQLKSENYFVNGGQVMSNGDSTNTTAGHYIGSTNTPSVNTISKLGTVLNDNTTGFKFTASQDVIVSASITTARASHDSNTNIVAGADSDLPDADAGGTAFNDFRKGSGLTISNQPTNTSAEFKLSKGEVFRFMATSSGARYTGNNIPCMGFTVTPQTSDVILLESQDEIFTDWQEYTPTFLNSPGISNIQAFFRRNGPNLEIKGRLQFGTMPAAVMALSLPSGYSIDINRLGGKGADDVYFQGRFIRVENTVKFNNADTNSSGLFFNTSESNRTTNLYVGTNYNGKSGNCIDTINYNTFGSTGDGAEFYASNIPISGFNANFNPLLSMPLQDFSSLENTFSARIACDSGGASITSQSESFIASVNRSTQGVIAVTFASGFFSQAPAVNATVENAENSDRYINVYSVSSTGFTASIEAPTDFNPRDNNFNVVVTRQGSDFRKAPQATAAVIKPAVAVISNTQSSATYQEGQFGGSNAYVDRVLNTIKGESWFVNSLSSNVFELQAGTYKVYASAPGYYINSNRIRLLNTTDSITQIQGQINYAASSYNGQSLAPLEGTFTITSAKSFKIQHINEFNYANDNALGNNSAAPSNGGESVFTRVTIEKLK